MTTGHPRLATDVLPGAAAAAASSAQGQPRKQQPHYTSTALQSGIAAATTVTRDGLPELPPLTVRVVASQLASGPATPGSLGSGASRDGGRSHVTGAQVTSAHVPPSSPPGPGVPPLNTAALARDRNATHDEEAEVGGSGLWNTAVSMLSDLVFSKPPGSGGGTALAQQQRGADGNRRSFAPGSPKRGGNEVLYSGGVVEVVAPGSPTAGNAGGMNAGIAASQHTGPTVVSACADGTLHVWRWTSRTCERILPAHRGAVHAVTFLPPGRCVTAGEDATLRVWHVKSGTCTASLEGHMAPVRCVAALPCGTKVVSGADDRSVCVWDVASGTVLRTMEGHTAAVCACAPMAGPPRALAGSIDVDAPLAAALPIHSATSASSGAGGNAHNSGWIASRVVTASLDGSLRVWDTSSGRC